MPLYEFQCSECGTAVELMLKVKARPPKCEECGGRLVKQVSAPAFQFKGTGWYVTDYAGKKGAGKEGGTKDADSGDKKGDSGDSGAAESSKTKSDSKSDSGAKKSSKKDD